MAVLFCVLRLTSFSQNDSLYYIALAKADSAYQFKWLQNENKPTDKVKFEFAKALYSSALKISPNNTYPANRIIEIDRILNGFKAREIVVFKDSFGNINQEQAIKLAEDFIRYNGYTIDMADKSKLSYELFDGLLPNDDSIIKHRSNSLHSKAFCISESKEGWHIGFLSTNVNLDKLDSDQRQLELSGRTVFVSKNAEEIRIDHKEPRFSLFRKL